MISQIPGGRISEIFSAKWAIFTAVFLNIIGTLLTPLAAEVEYLLMLLRSIEGVAAVNITHIYYIICILNSLIQLFFSLHYFCNDSEINDAQLLAGQLV